MKIRWTEPALNDLEAIGDYIAEHDPTAAGRIVQTIFLQVDRLTTFPNLRRPGRVSGTRELVVPTTPFVVPYRVNARQIEVLAVMHGARRWPDKFD